LIFEPYCSQIRAANNFDWITCAGLESVVQEIKKSASEQAPFVKALREICQELSIKADEGARVSVAPFIFWKSFDDALRKECNGAWSTLQAEFRSLEFLPKIPNLRLLDDGVHLQKKSANKYIEALIESSLKCWLEESDNDNEMEVEGDSTSVNSDGDRTIVDSTPGPAANQGGSGSRATSRTFKAASNAAAIKEIREELRSFKRSIESRLDQDLLTLAKHEEALDVVRNEKTLDRVLFSGVKIDKLSGTPAEKIPILKEAVGRILASYLDAPVNEAGVKIIPEIKFINHLNPQVNSDRRVIEARFESKEVAAKIREAFGRKKKEMRISGVVPDVLGGVNVNLSLTRETRVRIEVLKALAKIVASNTTSDVSAYVMQFSPRPLLKVVIKRGDSNFARVYGYTEAIEYVKENWSISDQDLFEAYNKAGNMKRLEQKFGLLKSSTFNQGPSDDNEQRRKKIRK